jgi:hypothetical protein
LDEAYDEIARRALTTFIADREPGNGADRLLNYDQKVFVAGVVSIGPTEDEVSQRTTGEVEPQQINAFGTDIETWRHTQTGLP